MGLHRLIIFLLLVVAGYWLWKKLSQQRSSPTNLPGCEQMVQCQRCSIYLPQQQAIHKNKKWYCSNEHASSD